MKRIEVTPADRSLHQELIDIIERHAGDLPPAQILAIGAQPVGQILTLQDPREINTTDAIRLIKANVEEGNRSALLTVTRGPVQ